MVAHRAIAALTFLPHPVQSGMADVDEIDDTNVGLGNVLAMQLAGVLLQRPFPRYRHSQDQGVERGMVEAFADESPGCKQDPRRIGWQHIEFRDEFRTLFFRYPPVQHEWPQSMSFQHAPDVVEMAGAFVSTSTLRPSSTVRCVSSAIAAVRCWSSAKIRNTS